MTPDYDLLVVGDANPDVVISGAPRRPAYGQREELVDRGELVLGGSGAITACGAARLGLRTAFAGRVGDDAAGRLVLGMLAERGVDTRHCVIDERPTALTVVLVDDGDATGGGGRAILTAPGCLPYLTAGDVPAALVQASRHVHVSSYFLQPGLAAGLPALFREARQAGATTSLDTNDDPAGEWRGLDEVLKEAGVLLPNAAEAMAITGEPGIERAVRALAARGVLPVVKDGAAGALTWENGTVVRVSPPPAPAAEFADTVGAGDSFNAGFIAARLRGLDLARSLGVAVACGSLSTRAPGGTAAQPTWNEVRTP
ncbi:carbohydrate kinase family protein [Sphaerisporangium corydalis]|uniref:Carbohydrate kinase family protein n=1 Tax=Sphaerisporangium corydalis TaxID=1441875 RepID=A0ABV9E826_9ACTN|nr:carbohydrate kinase family protein [Sphaerisporangium corydalis]